MAFDAVMAPMIALRVASRLELTRPLGTLFTSGLISHARATGTARLNAMDSDWAYTPPSRSLRCQ